VWAPRRKRVDVVLEQVPEHTGNLNWGGPDWNVLYVPSSTSVYRFPCKIGGNRLAYMS